jgi:uncharacterized caspase-like protein
MGSGGPLHGGYARAWRRAASALAALVWMVALAAAAPAAERLSGVALVVGQSAYEHLPPLANPANDARAIDDLLSDLGFEVDRVTDADQKKLAKALRRFAEDAAEADVALIYYSGHGIEAGGENFLVPIDADLTALDDALDRLVPLSDILDRLQKAVPVTIVLLDACRSNPFPPGATVKTGPDAEPAPIGVAGLSPPRGASALARTDNGGKSSLGAVIGFAAAPGRAALDGDPGGNSPYAAALLKHLSAAGYGFGDVMTLVTEEVYLKTGARQLPWTNSSLRRALFFGSGDGQAGDEPAGEEAAIRGERRKLLLTIAGMDQVARHEVAATAREKGVPMDALFAMLKAIGADTPQDPDALSRLLSEQSARLEQILAEREALRSSDPEITRLSKLAGEAVAEGALAAAIGFNEQAKRRIGELSAGVDDAEAELKARRLEFARIFADSGRTYALALDYGKAAEDFEHAFAEAERWDAPLALSYRLAAASALEDQGYHLADDAALDRASSAYAQAAAFASGASDIVAWAQAQRGLARVLWAKGDRTSSTTELSQAAALLRAAVARPELQAKPATLAGLQADLGLVLLTLGGRESGSDGLEAAAAALDAALAATDRGETPLEWARRQNRLGVVLMQLGQRQGSGELLEQAGKRFRLALEERRRDVVPVDWAQTTNNLALVTASLGERETAPAKLEESVALYRDALSVQTRERTPMLWAEAQANLGTSLFVLAGREAGTARLDETIAAFRLAALEITRERSPLKWAALQDNIGLALSKLGERSSDPARLREAVATFSQAIEARPRESVPLDWANSQNNLGNAHYRLAQLGGERSELAQAEAAYRAALEVRIRAAQPVEWAKTVNNLGNVLYDLAKKDDSVELFGQAAAQYRAALEVTGRESDPFGWGMTQNSLGETLLEIGSRTDDAAALGEARQAIEAARDVYLGAGQARYADFFAALLAQVDIAEQQIEIRRRIREAGGKP